MIFLWMGIVIFYNDFVIEMDVLGFGIEFQYDGQCFKFNELFFINVIDFSQKLKLEVVLVKVVDVVLMDMIFFVYVILWVDY